jgi:outer membrane lipoprotein SlyB
MARISQCLSAMCLVAFLSSGCASNYSPNTYASNAVQLANKVEVGKIVGFREVAISANGTIGTVTGGAAGGVLGSQYAESALAAVGATAVGFVVGNALDHAIGDTTGWEYIVRKANGDMISVTQRERTPLELGQKVLVIMGPQARVIADYSSIPEPPPAPQPKIKIEDKPQAPVKVEVILSLAPGVAAHLPAGQTIVAQSVSTDASVPTSASAAEASTYKPISVGTAEAILSEDNAALVDESPRKK